MSETSTDKPMVIVAVLVLIGALFGVAGVAAAVGLAALVVVVGAFRRMNQWYARVCENSLRRVATWARR